MDALAPSSDQIRVFLAVVEHGGFSAAARHLSRAQSAVTYAIKTLERDLGLLLFERSGTRPVLTKQGEALLLNARRVTREIEMMQRRALGLARGEEGEVRLAVDVMFPMARLVPAIQRFRDAFPCVSLRVFVEARGATAEKVIDRVYDLGVSGPLGVGVDALASTLVWAVERVIVAAPDHPLARWPGEIPAEELVDHVQLLTSDWSGPDRWLGYILASQATWWIGDINAKHEMIRAGLGWGSMPLHVVENDLREGRLVEIRPDGTYAEPWRSPLRIYAIYRVDAELGPAARCLLAALTETIQASPPSLEPPSPSPALPDEAVPS